MVSESKGLPLSVAIIVSVILSFSIAINGAFIFNAPVDGLIVKLAECAEFPGK